jgi:hypothetical protein
MLSHVVAGHVPERAVQMSLGGFVEQRAPGVTGRQRAGDRALAPRAAQIETVEVTPC